MLAAAASHGRDTDTVTRHGQLFWACTRAGWTLARAEKYGLPERFGTVPTLGRLCRAVIRGVLQDEASALGAGEKQGAGLDCWVATHTAGCTIFSAYVVDLTQISSISWILALVRDRLDFEKYF